MNSRVNRGVATSNWFHFFRFLPVDLTCTFARPQCWKFMSFTVHKDSVVVGWDAWIKNSVLQPNWKRFLSKHQLSKVRLTKGQLSSKRLHLSPVCILEFSTVDFKIWPGPRWTLSQSFLTESFSDECYQWTINYSITCAFGERIMPCFYKWFSGNKWPGWCCLAKELANSFLPDRDAHEWPGSQFWCPPSAK